MWRNRTGKHLVTCAICVEQLSYTFEFMYLTACLDLLLGKEQRNCFLSTPVPTYAFRRLLGHWKPNSQTTLWIFSSDPNIYSCVPQRPAPVLWLCYGTSAFYNRAKAEPVNGTQRKARNWAAEQPTSISLSLSDIRTQTKKKRQRKREKEREGRCKCEKSKLVFWHFRQTKHCQVPLTWQKPAADPTRWQFMLPGFSSTARWVIVLASVQLVSFVSFTFLLLFCAFLFFFLFFPFAMSSVCFVRCTFCC